MTDKQADKQDHREPQQQGDADTDYAASANGELALDPDDEAVLDDALASPEDAANAEDETSPAYVIGIGASAGGLEALQQFFDKMPPDLGAAFVIVQHLSPDFKSMMDELLARHTSMAIHRVEDGMRLQPNAIYLIPPKKEMIISDRKLFLTDKDPSQSLSLLIDLFFRSLAQDLGDHAVGIVLSGTGTDGSRGIRDIHEAGGLLIAQSEESASFDGMPRAAIDTGIVDFVLPPQAMPDALVRILKHQGNSSPQVEPVSRQQSRYTEILKRLLEEYGIDFVYYKPSTVNRRIERRMAISEFQDLDKYIEYIADNRSELDSLYKDLLIGVTRFFRDPEAFNRLERDVIPQLAEKTESEEGLRIWVPGCATGEEVYSIAMLIHERVTLTGRPLNVKIFATDVHRDSLEFASMGLYPKTAMGDMSHDRLKRYFIKEGDSFRVSPDLRRMVVFAPHNLIKDPPFTKVNFISCRNLLIYLQPIVQKKVLSLFHFSLKTGGVLFLGPSESLGELSDEFQAIDRHNKIFVKRRDVRLTTDTRFPLTPSLSEPPVLTGQIRHNTGAGETKLQRAYDLLLEKYIPAGLLINYNRELVHTFGDAGQFLRQLPGQFSADVLSMVDGDLRIAMAAAIQRASKQMAPVIYQGIRISRGEDELQVKLQVDPMVDRTPDNHYMLITMEPIAPAKPSSDDVASFDLDEESKHRIVDLERELQYTRENLQATVEELETSNEELQASNEELLASNEELQSTNEELHSVNEELYTVNAEYENKIKELVQLTNDMDNLLRSTEIGTVFVDRQLCIRKFTPAISDSFNLLPQDIGRPIEHIAYNIGYDNLMEDIQSVLDNGNPIETDITNRSDEYYLMRILPYRNEVDSIEGVVITFIDVKALKEAERDARETSAKLQTESQTLSSVIQCMGDGVIVADRELDITIMNPAAAELLGVESVNSGYTEWPKILGVTDFHTGKLVEPENQPIVRAVKGETVNDQILSLTPEGSNKQVIISCSARPLKDSNDQITGGVVVFRDITSAKQEEMRRQELEERIQQTQKLESLGVMAGGIAHDFNNLLMIILGGVDLALEDIAGDSLAARNLTSAKHAAEHAADLTDKMLAYAGKGSLLIKPLSINDVVEEMRPLLFHTIGKHIDMNLELKSQLPAIKADATHLEQIITNLVSNAAEAIDESSPGQISIVTDIATLGEQDESVLDYYDSFKPGEYVYLEVTDNGSGISPENMPNIFDPFYTTKFTGRGLGLASVLGIVLGHHGAISIDSEIDRGTTFRIYFPAVAEAGEAPAATPTPASGEQAAVSWTGEGKLMLVDDEQEVLEIVGLMIKRIGFEVDTFRSGEEAVKQFRGHEDEYRGAIIDLIMPNMDGVELYHELKKLSPELDIIVASGHSETQTRKRYADLDIAGYIHKPHNYIDLVKLLRSVFS
jgi:two-component system CheB/CheR fusion protein